MKPPWKAPLVAALLVACGSRQPAKDPVIQVGGDDPPTEALKYLPLEAGTVFAYDTVAESGDRGMLVLAVERPRAGRADLKVGGRTERLQIETAGISYVEGGFLLRTPLTAGASWRGKSGGTARVEAVDQTVSVPAGKFAGCLRVVEETNAVGASKVARSVYCPHVGLVTLDVEGVSDQGREQQSVVLRSFGPRVDLTGADVTTVSGEKGSATE